MKAPAKLHRVLQEMGFGYGIGAYFRMAPSAPFGVSWQLEKREAGLLLRPATCWWWENETAITVSPQEFDLLRRDGDLDGPPWQDDPSAFWDSRDVDSMIEGVRTSGAEHLRAMCEPGLMVRAYEFLKGGESAPPEAFPVLQAPWVERHASPNRTRFCSAYLLLGGRFDEAESMLMQLPKRSNTRFDELLLHAAQVRKVEVPQSSLDFLKRIGARVD